MFSKPRPVVWGILVGIVLGISQGIGMTPGENMPEHLMPLDIVIPFGLLGPPILLFIQWPIVRNGAVRRFLPFYDRIDLTFVIALTGISSAATGLLSLGSLAPGFGLNICAFAGSVGVGFLVVALVLRWYEGRTKPSDGPWS